jgi:carnitine 3-dehydrogenase
VADATRADDLRTVGLLGAGVIGAGWAARCLLTGRDVRLFDPDPEAPRKVAEVLDDARRAYARLTLAPAVAEGALTFVEDPEAAADGADFVQESAPERETLKRALLAAADRGAAPGVLIASSTSGLLPSRLQADMRHPERLVIGHPFNPVYLMPLVEICAGERTAPEFVAGAADVYRALGMHPLHVRKQIVGFIAARLMESLWREALWLVHDDVATVSEIDDALRFGPGLRWAFMGSFLTYRLGGGEAGMRHFMEQFGPSLQWPWSRLTDVPELDGDLLDRIVSQSDAQAAGADTQALTRRRDDCLIAILQGLRAQGQGAGTVLERFEQVLYARAHREIESALEPSDQPLLLWRSCLPPDWLDYNGHMNESRYVKAFGNASDALLRAVGADAEYVNQGFSFYAAESHVVYRGEVPAGATLAVFTQILAVDEKRLHLFHRLVCGDDDRLAATGEQMLLHVDQSAHRVCAARPDIARRLQAFARAHADLPRPDAAGRAVGVPERR